MNIRKAVVAVGLALASLGVASPAAAESYNFTLTFGDRNGAGSLTTAGDATAGQALVTNIDGTLDGQAISLLAPQSYAGNDNLFSTNSPFFSVGGLSFTAGGETLNIYNAFGTPTGCTLSSASCAVPVTFSLNAATAAVPEPATWMLMLGGFGAIGFFVRRQNRNALIQQVA